MMSQPAQSFNRVLAFEVAKDELVVHALPSGAQRRIANRAGDVTRLLRAAVGEHAEPLLVVCEASGGYEKHVLEQACKLSLACHRAHGARVRAFANYLGVAKTDAIDARVLALYASNAKSLRLYREPAPEQAAVRALKARRDEIQDMLIAETNRCELAQHRSVRASLGAHVRSLRRMLQRLEREIAELIAATPALAERARLMQTVIGVGARTAEALIAYFPELGEMSKGQAARLAGLAPMARDSGKTSAPRHIEPGRAALRRTLYMAALVAARRNPRLAAFAARLRAKGKPAKLVLTAVMRKLIVILNAVIQTGQPAHQLT